MKSQIKAVAIALLLVASPVVAQTFGGIYNPGTSSGGGGGSTGPLQANLVDPRNAQFGSNTCTGYYGLATSHLGSGGTGYVVGNTFSVQDAWDGANHALGHVTGVSGGVVTSYSIDTAGGAYNTAIGSTLTTTATSGSGTGLTIVVDTANPSGNDDTAAIHAALVYAISIGTGISAPTGCWVNNLTLPINSSINGTANAPTYGYDTVNNPTWFIWGTPTFGLNATGSANVSLTGFQVSGAASPGAFGSTACIGGTSQGGNFFGSRNFAINMAGKRCKVGLGTPDGAGSLILWTSINSDWGANNLAGVYGPFSDFASINDTIASSSNGIWLSSSGGGLAHIDGGRFEYINNYAVRLDSGGSTTQIENLQTDRAGYCAIYANSGNFVTVTGGEYKGSGLAGTLTVTGAANNGGGLIRLTVTGFGSNPQGGGTATSGLVTGDIVTISGVGGTTEANGRWTLTVVDGSHIDLQTSAFVHTYTSGGLGGVTGKDAYVCLNSINDFHASNVSFNAYSAGTVASSAYVLDEVSSDRISLEGGQAQIGTGNNSAYQVALTNYNGSTPAHMRINVPANLPFINDQSSFSFNSLGGMGLGTSNPNVNAVLDLASSALALALPTWTTGTRPSPSAGMIGYNSTIPGIEAYYNTTWNTLGGGGSGNMNTSTYDPAGVAQQLVGTTASQALTNKSVNGVTLTTAGLSSTYLNAAGGYTIPAGGGGGGTIATTTNLLAGDGSGNAIAAGAGNITSTSANALTVGANGATNPSLKVDASASSSATGITVTSAAAGAGASIKAISSGSDEQITVSSKGSGVAAWQGYQHYFQNTSGTTYAYLDSTGFSVFAPSRGFNSDPAFKYIGSAMGFATAGVNYNTILFDMTAATQHATGNITTNNDFYVKNTTQTMQAASTITTAATLAISGAPIAGTNTSITNAVTLSLEGQAVTSGATNSYGLSVNANSGATNNYAAQFIGSAGQIMNLRTDGHINILGTNAGSTGAQTINKPSGSVQFAGAATSLVVTDSLVTASSICIATVQTVDTTMKSVACTPGSGSFTLTSNAAATGTTVVGWLVIN